MILLAIFSAGLAAALLSWGLGFATRRLAPRLGYLDRPGGRKAHENPTPLLGGAAIFLAIALPAVAAALAAHLWAAGGMPAWLAESPLSVHLPGAAARTPMLLAILAGAAALHVLGLIDDRRPLGARAKLLVQLLVATALAAGVEHVRILTALGPIASTVATVLWIVAITNALNFLDNTDGLAAGVGAICAAGLLASAMGMGQIFVAALAAMIAGALAGFLPHNFPPARSFMGDAGSLTVGYLLAVASCLTTYVPPGRTYYLYGVFVPVVLMAVPLYDMLGVIVLRLRAGQNPMHGDRRHFSHRLLDRGMPVRKAVLTIYLCTAITTISASLLARVRSNVEALLIFAQVLAVLAVVALLESTEGERP